MTMQDSAAPTQKAAVNEGRTGLGKVGAAILAGWLASYFMNQLSLHGINFTAEGVPSEVVKSTIEGGLVGLFVWATPSHFREAVTDAIIFVKSTFKQWGDAWDNPPPT